MLVMVNVLEAAMGGVWALWLTGTHFSVSAAVGFISIFGVAIMDGLLPVSYFNHLRFDRLPLQTQCRQSEWQGGSAETSNGHDLSGGNLAVPHYEPSTGAYANGPRHLNLNWIGRSEDDAEHPRSGGASKDSLRGKYAPPRPRSPESLTSCQAPSLPRPRARSKAWYARTSRESTRPTSFSSRGSPG